MQGEAHTAEPGLASEAPNAAHCLTVIFLNGGGWAGCCLSTANLSTPGTKGTEGTEGRGEPGGPA